MGEKIGLTAQVPDELAGDFYDSALGIPAFKLLELAPDFLNTLKAHFAKDLPSLRQLEADLQELEALAELLDFCLVRIKNNAERVADLFFFLLSTGRSNATDSSAIVVEDSAGQ